MNSEPRILAIETSGRTGSVAVAIGPTLLASRDLPPTSRHAAELMPAIRDLTRAQNWQPADIDHIYLSIGPGSFTGLRIATAIARAIHQATNCKLVAVPSLDVIAQNAPQEFQIVIPLLDAKRTQVFAARYQRTESGTLTQTAPPALVDPATFIHQALTLASQLQSKIENQKSKIQIALLGEALSHYLPPSSPQITPLPQPLWHGTAATVHSLGYALAQQNLFANPHTLLPLYIRLPEAEEVYRKKHNLPVS